RDKAAGISVQRSTLEVQPDKTLALVGGGVLLSGANLNAPGGQVELGGLAGIGAVGLNVNSNLLQLNFLDGIARSAISITNKSSIDVRARNGGNITINAQILNIFGESSLQAGSCSCSESVGVQNGDITLNVTGAVSIRQSSSVRNDLGSKAAGESGNIIITAGSLSLADKALITNSTFGQGNSGSITINVRDNVSLTGDNTSIFGSAALGSVGDAGNINIEANSLSLSNGARLATDTFGKGNAGNVSINVRDRFSMAGDGTTIFSTVASGAIGNGGEITIKAKSISLTDGAFLIGRTFGQGNAGSISVQAEDSVSLENSFVLSNVEAEAIGKGGNISIQSGSLSLSDGAELVTTTLGQGDAGSVTIKASGIVSFDGVSKSGLTTGVFSTVEAGAKGKGGDIRIQSGELSLTNGATLSTTTYGQGNSGSIEIQAQQLLLSNGSQMLAATSGHGDAGNILVQGDDSISLIGSSTAISSSVNPGSIGNGGNINIKTGSLSLSDGSGIFNSLETDAVGNAGNINITTISFSVINGSQVIASTRGRGDAGDVTIQATDTVFLDGVGSNGFTSGISSSVENGGEGKGGDINITTGSLSVTNRAQLATGSRGQGSAGSINITARDSISFSGESAALSRLEEFGSVGKSGDINITTGSLFVTDGSNLATSTRGQGDAGNITITARDAALFDGVSSNRSTSGAFSTVEAGAVGNGGDITLTARSLSVTNGAALTASTRGTGNAGNVTIQVDDSIFLDGTGGDQLTNPSGASSVVNSGAIGNGGNVTVTTGSLSMTNGAVLLATTFGNGNAGNVNVKANNEVYLDGSFINSAVIYGAVGNGGNITIAAKSVSLLNGAGIGASTFGNGNSGSVFLQAEDSISLSGESTGIRSTVDSGVIGNGGNIEIKTGSLSLSDGALFSTSTFGQGNAGSVFVQAEGSVLLSSSNTNIFSTVEAGAVGKGGDINITAGSLSLTNGSQLQTLVRETSGTIPGGRGNAGNVRIEVRDALTLSGKIDGIESAIISDLGIGAVGNSGDVTLIAKSVLLSDGARISTSTFGQGNAGSILVQAQDSVSLNNGNLFTTLEFGAVGRGGDISITANHLVLTEGSKISSSTLGQGDSGNVILENRRLVLRDGAAIAAATASGGKGGTLSVTASDSIELIGATADGQSSSGLTTQSEADGAAGNLIISTERLILQDRAEIAVAAKGKGAAGNLEVTADSIRLNNGTMTGETAAGDRGNITLQSQDVQLRRTSSITTNAQGIATGGNITIDTGILAALENSDIRANAQQGSGGQVRINAQAIFGSVSRTREDLQTLLNTNDPNLLDPSLLPTSDITAISQQGGPQSQGSVQLITPDVDPSSGLIELPQTIVDPDALIAQNPCTLGKGSEFTVTGRGGLPPNPSEALSSRTVRVSLVEPTQASTTSSNTAISVRSPRPDSLPIVPAQGWILNEKGQLVFTAYDPTGTGSNRLGRNPPTCPAR
ncbi:S-layer family protein, partial [Planktothrix sp. FACHB-1355]